MTDTDKLVRIRAGIVFEAKHLTGFGKGDWKDGARAVEHLSRALSELQVAHVRNQVMFSLFTDFENYSEFKPTEQSTGTSAPMVDQLVSWAKGFATVR